MWQAHDLNAFNRTVVRRLAAQLELLGEDGDAQLMREWIARLDALTVEDHHSVFDNMQSGRLLKWLASRQPVADQVESIAGHLAANDGGPLVQCISCWIWTMTSISCRSPSTVFSKATAKRSGLWCSPQAKHRRQPLRKTRCTFVRVTHG
jgi:hypothetical protein